MAVRLPQEIRADLRIIVDAQSLTVNALIAAAVEELLARNGRGRICEVAPWYAAYLTCQGLDEEDDIPPP